MTKDWKELLFLREFISGVIFALVGIPILEIVADILVSGAEVIKGYFALKVTKINNQISKIQELEKELSPNNIIGFSVPEEKEDDE